MESIKKSEWSGQAGKGDQERPVDRKKYRANFDDIDWSAHRNKKKKRERYRDDD